MKNSFASGLKKFFFTAISILSMVTSFLFFIEIFNIGGSVSNGDTWAIASTLVTGLVGVLILDVAALVWLKVYLNASDNHDERSLATVGMVVGFIGSSLSSFAYLVLVASTTITVDPAWSQYVTYAMAVILIVHFALVFLSAYKSTAAQIDERTSDMMSKATQEMLTLMEDDFMKRIPGLAEINAQKLSRQLTQRFSSLSVFDVNEQPSPPFRNGHAPARMNARQTANVRIVSAYGAITKGDNGTFHVWTFPSEQEARERAGVLFVVEFPSLSPVTANDRQAAENAGWNRGTQTFLGEDQRPRPLKRE